MFAHSAWHGMCPRPPPGTPLEIDTDRRRSSRARSGPSEPGKGHSDGDGDGDGDTNGDTNGDGDGNSDSNGNCGGGGVCRGARPLSGHATREALRNDGSIPSSARPTAAADDATADDGPRAVGGGALRRAAVGSPP